MSKRLLHNSPVFSEEWFVYHDKLCGWVLFHVVRATAIVVATMSIDTMYIHLPPGGCTLTITGLHPLSLLQGNFFLRSSQMISHSSGFFFQLLQLIRHGRLLSLSLDHLHLELSGMELGKVEVIHCRNTPLSEKNESVKPGLWTWPWTEIFKFVYVHWGTQLPQITSRHGYLDFL